MEDLEDGDSLRLKRAGLDPHTLEVASDYFPSLEAASPEDLAFISRACGRDTRGVVLVAARCPHGRPAVILTVPFEPPAGQTAPPLLWLTCPAAATGAARLEASGMVRDMSGRLAAEGEAAARFASEEEDFGRMLHELALAASGMRLSDRLRERGAAGGRPGAVKCLHAHLAHRLATGHGVVGEWCLEELDGPGGAWCESIPQACLH